MKHDSDKKQTEKNGKEKVKRLSVKTRYHENLVMLEENLV